MTDPELAGETAEKIVNRYGELMTDREGVTALILAAFARRDAAMGATEERTDHGLQAMQNALAQHRAASRAIPITPGTVVPFDPVTGRCWLWDSHPRTDHCSWPQWERISKVTFDSANPPHVKAEWTHYHPDQPTAPTCRPYEKR